MNDDNNEPRISEPTPEDANPDRPPASASYSDCPQQSSARPFTPVPVRARHDGWTPERQVAFIKALAVCLCVDKAAAQVGMSATSAYNLYNREDARHFRGAWDAALDMTNLQVEMGAVRRSIHGVPRPVFYKGEQVGEWRHHDERMTMFLLRYRRRARFGAWHDLLPLCPPPLIPGDERDDSHDDSAERLDWHCEEIEEEAWRESQRNGASEDEGAGDEPADTPDPAE